MSASFNLLVKTFLRRFDSEAVNYIRSGLKCEYEPERRLKMDSMTCGYNRQLNQCPL